MNTSNTGQKKRLIPGVVIMILCLLPLFLFTFFAAFGPCAGYVPFSICYGTWVETPLAFFVLFCGILVAYAVSFGQYRPARFSKVIGISMFLVSLAGLITYFAYHRQYKGDPYVTVWMDPEKVTPYHVQLGNSFFIGFALIQVMIFFLRPVNIWIRIGGGLVVAAGILLTFSA